MSMPAATPSRRPDTRPRALQDELRELAEVVGPVPLVDMLFERSFQLNVTDIHLDPNELGLRVRIRMDGVLHDVAQLPPATAVQVVNRLKLMGGENIVERRHAQDGHITVLSGGRQRDIRVGSGPTMFGERLVLRLMPDQQTFLHLNELGFELEQEMLLRDALQQPFGTILSVGPVGSGKSTLMYSCLEMLNDPGKSLVTIEDPVERRIRGVNQMQVDHKIGFTFVDALRGILRQDPNILMIGEIRDPETAHIGIRAGRSGVLVMSTLHSNDAIGSIDMLRDFGITAAFLADSLQLVVSTRLVRRVCLNCREAYEATDADCHLLELDDSAHRPTLYRGRGCEACFETGYHGRMGVFEVLVPGDALKHAIIGGATRSELTRLAEAQGMRTLVQSSTARVTEGVTTTDELKRVIRSRPLH